MDLQEVLFLNYRRGKQDDVLPHSRRQEQQVCGQSRRRQFNQNLFKQTHRMKNTHTVAKNSKDCRVINSRKKVTLTKSHLRKS